MRFELIVTGFMGLLLVTAVSCTSTKPTAPHEHGDHDHAAMSASNAYADSIKEIRSHMASINTIIASGNYKAVHNDAEAIVSLCDSLEKLAADTHSGVPRDKVPAVAQQAKELSTAAEDMHDAAHGGEVPKLKEHFAHMGKVVDSLAQYIGGN